MPRNGADRQAAYHGQKRRTLVLDLFRGLTIPRNPNLLQCLPAKTRFEFDNKPELTHLQECEPVQCLDLRQRLVQVAERDRRPLAGGRKEERGPAVARVLAAVLLAVAVAGVV